MKKVSDLTPEEFLKTVPITLKPHDPAYALWYEEEKRRIIETVGEENTARMNHIGSSAVPGLTAKPIVDMLLEIDGTCHVEALLEKLRAIGYGEEVLTRKTDPFRLLAEEHRRILGKCALSDEKPVLKPGVLFPEPGVLGLQFLHPFLFFGSHFTRSFCM